MKLVIVLLLAAAVADAWDVQILNDCDDPNSHSYHIGSGTNSHSSGSESGSKSGSHSGTKSGSHSGSISGSHSGSKSGSHSGSKSGSHSGSESGSQSGSMLNSGNGSGSKSGSGSGHGSGSHSESGSKSQSWSKSHSWSWSWSKSESVSESGSSSRSKSNSQSGSSQYHGHYVYPKCCDACDLLRSQETSFYKECGKYLLAADMENVIKTCVAIKGDMYQIDALFEKLRTKCYYDLAVIVRFKCPPKEVPNVDWSQVDAETLRAWRDSCQGSYCPAKYQECDQCQALLDENSHFFQVCGNKIDANLRKIWYMRCRTSSSQCHWQSIYATILGFCHCQDPKVIPNFCKIMPPTTTPKPITTPPPICVMADGTKIPVGSTNVVVGGCKQICNCTVAGMPTCEAISCHANATCNNNKCVCITNFTGDGYQCFPPPIEECKGQAIDLVFLVDVSQSISGNDFKKEVEFLQNVVSKVDINVTTTHVGIIRFSFTAVVEAPLFPHNKADLANTISGIIHEKGLTFTDLAINKLIQMFEDDGRADARKVVIIVTDGRSTDQAATVFAMKEFRDKYPNAVVIAVGVLNSGDVDQGELNMLASGLLDDNVLNFSDFDALLEDVNNIAMEACMDNENDEPLTEDGKTVPECTSLTFYGPDTNRWLNYYGVYDIILGLGLCNGEFVYLHVDQTFFLQWNYDEATWEISEKPCVFGDNVQPVARLVYGVEGSTHVITEQGDIWNEPPWNPTYTQAKIKCFETRH